jgi:hypothetical protein
LVLTLPACDSRQRSSNMLRIVVCGPE